MNALANSKVAPLLVIGSMNIDYIASVATLPEPGETVTALGLIRRFGGKGANQAVAAARQRGRVRIIGCLGDDDGGHAYCKRLKDGGIDVRGITFTIRALTGTALIAVDRKGENTIVVAAGANGLLTPNVIQSSKDHIASASIILLQFEIPMKTNLAVLRLANRAGVPVVLNPSPFCNGFPWGRHRLDTIIVNSGEAKAVFGLAVENIARLKNSWRRALRKAKVDNLVITRGARPTVLLNGHQYFEVPPLPVKPIDTVGAGDTFTGTFAARRAEGVDALSAIRLANCAGALATLLPGAQEAIPSREATEKAVRRLPR